MLLCPNHFPSFRVIGCFISNSDDFCWFLFVSSQKFEGKPCIDNLCQLFEGKPNIDSLCQLFEEKPNIDNIFQLFDVFSSQNDITLPHLTFHAYIICHLIALL